MMEAGNKQQGNKAKKVWDRKRKKYVSNQQEQDKRIKTESGNWIKQSFKTGKYEEYKQKAKSGLDNAGSDDDGVNEFNSSGMSSHRMNKERLSNTFNARRRG